MLLDRHKLREEAHRSLSNAPHARRVVLIHTGAILLFSLLLMLADYLLDRQISTTGGLRGMDNRAILCTIQMMLRLIQLILLPFWQIGYIYYALQVAKGDSTGAGDLMEGFRRFAPVLRLKLLLTAISLAAMLISAYASCFVFLMSPLAKPLLEFLEAVPGDTIDEAVIMEALKTVPTQNFVPAVAFFVMSLLAGLLFLFYRYRMAEMWLMNHPEGGAWAALRNSGKGMKGNFKAILKIDLGFWWFYLLEVLVTVIGYGDVILGAFGMELSTDAFTTYFLFFTLYLLLQLALYWWKRNEVAVTYAHAYCALFPQEDTKSQQ